MDVRIYGSGLGGRGGPLDAIFSGKKSDFPLAFGSRLGYNTRMSNTENFQAYDALMYERAEVEEVYMQFIDCQACYDTGMMDAREPCYCDRGRSLILNIRSL